MGKQSRLRKERKAQGGMSERNCAVEETVADNLGQFLMLNRDRISNSEDQFRAILFWVNSSPGNLAVEMCAATVLMHTGEAGYPSPINDGQLRWLRNELFYEMIAGNHAARRVLTHIPISKDDDDLLCPFKEMPVGSGWKAVAPVGPLPFRRS